jgi:hypothetical protein
MAIEEIGSSMGQNTASSVPPPPAEVKVRTMKSDLEALAKNGGALPQFRSVPVEGLSLSKAQSRNSSQPQVNPSLLKKSDALWGVIALAVGALLVLIWFGYTAFKH